MSDLNQPDNHRKTNSTNPRAEPVSDQKDVDPDQIPNFKGEQFSRLAMFRSAATSGDTKPEEPQA